VLKAFFTANLILPLAGGRRSSLTERDYKMATKLICPFFASLALAVAGCQEGTTREDVADARADVQEEQQDVAEAQADAQSDIAAAQDDADEARREANKPVLDGDDKADAQEDIADAQADIAEAQADANAEVQDEQADVAEAQKELQQTEAELQQTQARDAFAQQAEQQLALADKKIEELKDREDNADGAAEQATEDQIEKLQAQRDRVEDGLDDMKSAEVMNWQDHQRNVQLALSELNRMMQEIQ